jgi:hypothetical protein
MCQIDLGPEAYHRAVLRSAQYLGVTLVLSVLGCHRATSEGFVCGTRFQDDDDEARSGPPPTPIGDANFDRCADAPLLRHPELTQEQAFELAKVLVLRAKELEASNDHVCRLALLEHAYYLVPGKHTLAFMVGEQAFAVGDCEKASMFLRHFLAYEEPLRQPDRWARAQELVTQIETLGCGQQP